MYTNTHLDQPLANTYDGTVSILPLLIQMKFNGNGNRRKYIIKNILPKNSRNKYSTYKWPSGRDGWLVGTTCRDE